MNLSKNFLSKLHYLLTILLAAFPVIPLHTTPLIIILWTVVSILGFGFKITTDKYRIAFAILSASVFFLYLFELIFTVDTKNGRSLVEKNLCLVVFPLAWCFIPFSYSKSQIQNFFTVFIVCCVTLVVYTNICIYMNGVPEPNNTPEMFNFQYRTIFEEYSKVHPTYMCVFNLFGALVLLDFLRQTVKTNPWWKNLVALIFILILVSSSIFLAARIPLTGFVIAVLLLVYFHKLYSKKLIISLGAGIVLLAIAIMVSPTMRSRLTELTGNNLTPPAGQNFNSVNLRAGIYTCSVQLLKTHWLAGIPPGDLQKSLNECYTQFSTTAYTEHEYNTHNEFFNKFLSFGIAGFILFVAAFIVPLVLSIKQGQYLYSVFIVFFSICCLTENLLARQMGILFYTFFNSLFAFNFIFKNREIEEEKLRLFKLSQ